VEWVWLTSGDQGDFLRKSVYNQDKRALFPSSCRENNALSTHCHSPFGQESSSVTRSEPDPWNSQIYNVKLFISGYVFTMPGTRANLVAHLGDTTTLAPLPESPSDQSILQALEATLPAGVDVRTTLFLLAERNSGEESLVAYLDVSSLDFT